MAKKQVAVSLRKPPSPEKADAFVAGATDGKPAQDGVKSRPAADKRAHDDGKPAEAKQERAPAARARAQEAQPSVHEAQPSVHEAQPSVHEAQPSVHEAQPSVHEAQPSAQEAQPSVHEAQPSVHEAQPSAQEAQPSAEPAAAAAPQPLATISEPPAIPPVLVGNDGRARRAVTVYLPDPLADRLVLHCIEHDRDVSNLIGEAIEVHLDRRLGPASVSAAPAADGAAAAEAAPAGPSYRADPFRAADTSPKGRIDRMVQVGRVLMTLWRERPRAS
ncbi:hypothetical protein [Sorangium sp. So ce1182]|uniref:hypothetical protein n=1 Tax=Sorangium sp. So ce1182 TaxID=3133334 RepID=UPI003F637CB2